MSYKCVLEKYNIHHVWSVVVHADCDVCKKSHILTIPETEWLSWKSGELIQKSILSLSAGERELLITGTCSDCFDEIFNEADVIESAFITIKETREQGDQNGLHD